MSLDLARIKDDLNSMTSLEFYIKYIVKTQIWYFNSYCQLQGDAMIDCIDSFKETVSNVFGVSFHSAQIVGSAKLGWSLSPHKPLQPFKETGDPASDIDIAIISPSMFSKIWDDIRLSRRTSFVPDYLIKDISLSIYRGYINDKQIFSIKRIKAEWEDRVGKANQELQDKLGFVHAISYRVYRSWEDIEEYQIDAIDKTKKVVGGNADV